MNFDHARKIAEKLENNLNILQQAAEFINDTHEIERNYGKEHINGIFATLKQALIVFLNCNGDKNKLTAFIKSMEEIANNPPESYGVENTFFGTTLVDLINAPYIFREEKYLDYNIEADRILKEIEAQLSVLCSEFSIEKPKNVSSGELFSGFQSNVNRLEQAFNVVKAVKSLVD